MLFFIKALEIRCDGCEQFSRKTSIPQRFKSVLAMADTVGYPLVVLYWMIENTSYLSPMAFLPLR
jgi:hypothetical protein